MKQKSENRRALPKFFLTILLSLLAGGAIGFAVGLSHVFGLDTDSVATGLNRVLQGMTPWAIPATSALFLGGACLLHRAAHGKISGWDGGDETGASEDAERLLSWALLLSSVQLLINFFFLAAAAVYELEGSAAVAEFVVSCALVIFTQQKVVDLTKRIKPEKRGSVYDTKFQKKWLESCDEFEQRQIGQACYRAYQAANRVCIGLWLGLVVLSMVFRISLLPVFVLLLILGTLQVTYTLECIRLSRKGAGE